MQIVPITFSQPNTRTFNVQRSTFNVQPQLKTLNRDTFQLTKVQTAPKNQISFTADLKRLFDKGLIPEVKKGFYGVTLNSKNVSREHLLPKSKGGTLAEANIVLADKLINNARGSKPITKVADKENAVNYLKQFVDIDLPEFNGKRYIGAVVKTLKRLGLDLTEEAKEMGVEPFKKLNKMG